MNESAIENIEQSELNKVLDNFPLNRINPILKLNGKVGHVILIVGNMFSGKTSKFIELIQEAKKNNLNVEVFKPSIDTRYSSFEVVSHNKISIECENITFSSKFSDKIKTDTHLVAIDEIQFLDDNMLYHIEELKQKGKIILLTGLDLDFKQEPFNIMRDLMPRSDYIFKLQSKCYICNNVATKTQRLIKVNDEFIPAGYFDPVFKLGTEDCYRPVCNSHHKIVY